MPSLIKVLQETNSSNDFQAMAGKQHLASNSLFLRIFKNSKFNILSKYLTYFFTRLFIYVFQNRFDSPISIVAHCQMQVVRGCLNLFSANASRYVCPNVNFISLHDFVRRDYLHVLIRLWNIGSDKILQYRTIH